MISPSFIEALKDFHVTVEHRAHDQYGVIGEVRFFHGTIKVANDSFWIENANGVPICLPFSFTVYKIQSIHIDGTGVDIVVY